MQNDKKSELRQDSHQSLPITFRIPRAGRRDSVFNLTRSWYYAQEAAGKLSLIRLRDKGKTRGCTLVRVADVEALINAAEPRGGV